MKIVKKCVQICSLCVMFSFSVIAQSADCGSGMLGLNALDLSADQQQELKSIFFQQKQEWNTLKASDDGYHMFQVAKKSLEKELLEVLTTAQLTEYGRIKECRVKKYKKTQKSKEFVNEYMRLQKMDNLKEAYPDLIEKRASLNEIMSSTDIATVTELREVLVQFHDVWVQGFDNWDEKVEYQKEKWEALSKLNVIAKKYEPQIKDLIGRRTNVGHVFSQNESCGAYSEYLCSKKASIFLLINAENGTDIIEKQKSTMLAYPNPVHDKLTIQYYLPNSGDIELILTNENGSLIKSIYNGYHEEGNHEVIIDTNGLSSRAYFLNLVDKTGNTVEKIIVTKDYE